MFYLYTTFTECLDTPTETAAETETEGEHIFSCFMPSLLQMAARVQQPTEKKTDVEVFRFNKRSRLLVVCDSFMKWFHMRLICNVDRWLSLFIPRRPRTADRACCLQASTGLVSRRFQLAIQPKPPLTITTIQIGS